MKAKTIGELGRTQTYVQLNLRVEQSEARLLAGEAEKKKGEVQAVKDTLAGEAEVVREMKDSVEQDLLSAMPALGAAEHALNTISARDIGLLKQLKQPPDLVKRVFDVVLLLFQKEVVPCMAVQVENKKAKLGTVLQLEASWSFALSMMADISFLSSLVQFNKDAINDETIEMLFPYLNAPDFTSEDAKRVAGALAGLCTWARAMVMYVEIAKVVKPKREALKIAEEKLKSANARLTKMQPEFDTTSFTSKTSESDGRACATLTVLEGKPLLHIPVALVGSAQMAKVPEPLGDIGEVQWRQANNTKEAMAAAERRRRRLAEALRGRFPLKATRHVIPALRELQSMRSPPVRIQRILGATLLLLAPAGFELTRLNTSWAAVWVMLGSATTLAQRLHWFGVDCAPLDHKGVHKVVSFWPSANAQAARTLLSANAESTLDADVGGAEEHAKVSDPQRLNEKGVLSVHLKRGIGLKAIDLNGKADPYVIVSSGSHEKKSRAVKKTLDPEWNEMLEFEGSLKDFLSHGLLLKVMDKDPFTIDDPLGDVQVSLEPLRSTDTHDFLEPLPAQGSVKFTVSWKPAGLATGARTSRLGRATTAPDAGAAVLFQWINDCLAYDKAIDGLRDLLDTEAAQVDEVNLKAASSKAVPLPQDDWYQAKVAETQATLDSITANIKAISADNGAFAKAAAALDGLNSRDLSELKRLKKPPAGVTDVTAACLCLLQTEDMPFEKVDTSWKAATAMMSPPTEFLKTMLGLKQRIDDGVVPKSNFPNIQELLKLEHFDYKIQRKKSNAAAGLTDFIININAYNDLNASLEPLRNDARVVSEELELAKLAHAEALDLSRREANSNQAQTEHDAAVAGTKHDHTNPTSPLGGDILRLRFDDGQVVDVAEDTTESVNDAAARTTTPEEERKARDWLVARADDEQQRRALGNAARFVLEAHMSGGDLYHVGRAAAWAEGAPSLSGSLPAVTRLAPVKAYRDSDRALKAALEAATKALQELPAIGAAEAEEAALALSTLTQDDVTRLCSFAEPHPMVQDVCLCVGLVKGIEDVTWKGAKAMMSDPDFLHTLMELDKDHLDGENIKMVKAYFQNQA